MHKSKFFTYNIKNVKIFVSKSFTFLTVKLNGNSLLLYNINEVRFMLKREQYLNQLIEAKDLNLIKVITGVRRSGKSTLLLQYKEYLISQNIHEKNIIYMNFESAEWYSIKDYEDLYSYIKENISKGKNYILLDEVQNVENWEKL